MVGSKGGFIASVLVNWGGDTPCGQGLGLLKVSTGVFSIKPFLIMLCTDY